MTPPVAGVFGFPKLVFLVVAFSWLLPFGAAAQEGAALPEGWVAYELGGIGFGLPADFVMLEEVKEGGINHSFYGRIDEASNTGSVVIVGYDEAGFVDETLNDMATDSGVVAERQDARFALGPLMLDHYIWNGAIDGTDGRMQLFASPESFGEFEVQLAIAIAHRGQPEDEMEAFDPAFLQSLTLSLSRQELGLAEAKSYLGGIVEYIQRPGVFTYGDDNEFYADIGDGNDEEIELRAETGRTAVRAIRNRMQDEFSDTPVFAYGYFKGLPAFIAIGTPSFDMNANHIEGPTGDRAQVIALDMCDENGEPIAISMQSTQSWLDANGGWEAVTGGLSLTAPEITATCQQDDWLGDLAEAAGLVVPVIKGVND